MSTSNSLLSRMFGSRKKIIKELSVKLKRSPKCLRLQRVQTEGTKLDYNKWDQVKLEVLEGAFKINPAGCFIAHSTPTRFEKQYFKPPNSMQVKYSFTDKSKMYLVLKDKWSRTELDDIATGSISFAMNIRWMLPNMEKVMTLNEAIELSSFFRNLSFLKFDSEYLDKGEWETIGCIRDEEMTWTNPPPKSADLVVENLKKLCSELEIELEEV